MSVYGRSEMTHNSTTKWQCQSVYCWSEMTHNRQHNSINNASQFEDVPRQKVGRKKKKKKKAKQN